MKKELARTDHYNEDFTVTRESRVDRVIDIIEENPEGSAIAIGFLGSIIYFVVDRITGVMNNAVENDKPVSLSIGKCRLDIGASEKKPSKKQEESSK